jgi:hypothetical protein
MSSLINIADQLTYIYRELLPHKKKYLGHCHDLDYDGKEEVCRVCEKKYILDPSQIIIFREIHGPQCTCGCSDCNGVYICPHTECPQNKIKENFKHLSNLIEEYILSLKCIRVLRTNGDIETDWKVPHFGMDPYHKWGFDYQNNCISVKVQKESKIEKIIPFDVFVEWQCI